MESVAETGAATVLDFLKGLRHPVELTFKEGKHAAWLYDVHLSRVGGRRGLRGRRGDEASRVSWRGRRSRMLAVRLQSR